MDFRTKMGCSGSHSVPAWIAVGLCVVTLGLASSIVPAAPAMAQSLLPEPIALHVVEQIGGETRGVAWSEGRSYIGSGPRVLVVDGEEGDPPRILGRSPVLPGIVEHLWVASGIALVEVNERTSVDLHGLRSVHLLDLRDPGRPRVLARLTDGFIVGAYPHLALLDGGRVAVVGTFDTLRSFDLSDPAHPVEHDPLPLVGSFVGLAVDGNDLFVAQRHVRGQDFPARITDLLRYTIADAQGGLALEATTESPVGYNALLGVNQGTLLWASGNERFHITGLALEGASSFSYVDTPQTEGAVFGPAGIFFPTGAGVIGHVEWGEGEWRRAADIELPEGWSVHQLAATGSGALVAAGGHGATGWDVTGSDVRPRPLPSIGPGYVADVAVGGCCAFVGTSQGLSVVDLAAPGGPRVVDHRAAPSALLAVAARGSRVVTAAHRDGEPPVPGLPRASTAVIDVLEVDARGRLTSVATLERHQHARPREIALDGRHAVVGLESGVLLHVDLGDVPSIVRRQVTNVSLVGLDADRGRLAVAFSRRGQSAGFWAFDADAESPVVARERLFEAPFTAAPAGGIRGDVGVYGDGRDLYTLDLGSPGGPRILGRVELGPSQVPSGFGLQEIEGAKGVSRNEIGIHIAGTNAWVAHAVGGVFGVDLRLPNLPEVVAAFNTPGRARRVVVAGDRVYVADGDGGLLVLGWEGWAPRSQAWLPWVSAGGSASAAAEAEDRARVLDAE